MTQFLTRVELHGAKHGDASYDTLHSEMAKRGLKRTIPTADKDRKLPTAGYDFEGDDRTTPRIVFDRAKAAADATSKTSEIISAKMDGFITDCPLA